jgi:hypothetical protein
MLQEDAYDSMTDAEVAAPACANNTQCTPPPRRAGLIDVDELASKSAHPCFKEEPVIRVRTEALQDRDVVETGTVVHEQAL